MNYSKSVRKWASILMACLLLIGCNSLIDNPTNQTQQPSEPLAPTGTITLAKPTASPTSCVGWYCEIDGVVYLGSVDSGNEMAGVPLKLSQHSWCSPTAGDQETQSGPYGTFAFEVYIHDTDSIIVKVDLEGYQPVKVKMGGFDCLYCSCPFIEIVLVNTE